MLLSIIIVIAVLILMTIAIFFILKKTVNNINNQAKVYFTLKAQQYTDELEKEEKEEEKEEEETTQEEVVEKVKDNTVVYIEEKKDYEVEDLLKIIKKVDDKFSFDSEIIIKKFIKEKTNNDEIKTYLKLIKMKDYITYIGVYNILTSQDNNLITKIKEELKYIDEDIFNKYNLAKQNFEVEDFLNYIEYEISKCDPTVYIMVGEEKINFDYIDKRIKTVYSPKIYKGLQIIYKNKMYDYSLS